MTDHIETLLQHNARNFAAVDSEGQKDLGAHYRYAFKGVKIDPYRVMEQYRITHPAHQHAVKKLLRAVRGDAKDLRQDLAEVQMTIARWIEMLDEDAQ